MDDWRNIRTWSRDEMMKRVARFRNLKGSDGGLPDSPLPECRRRLFNVIGFQPPAEGNSPVGANASAMPAIPIAEGFNLGYCKARPGKGPLMHNHDTNETFICMTGRWRAEWNEGDATQYVDLEVGQAERLLHTRRASAQQRTNACQQFGKGERFHEVIVGAELESANPLMNRVARG